jgi:hypothetical protein
LRAAADFAASSAIIPRLTKRPGVGLIGADACFFVIARRSRRNPDFLEGFLDCFGFASQ